MRDNYLKLDKIENLIRSGKLVEARKLIKGISPKEIYAADLVYYCSLLRRIRLSALGAKALQPMIYPKSRDVVVATNEEKLEYAACLTALGALAEAERILDTVNTELHPITLIRKAFINISKWNYDESNKLLNQYIVHKKADPYTILVAQVNLLQGLIIMEELVEAEELVKYLIETLLEKKNVFLLVAVYEFASELCRLQNKLQQGLNYINLGKKVLVSTQSVDFFLLEKQELLLTAYLNFSPLLQNDFKRLILKAKKIKHYESVRDLNFHQAIVFRDNQLIHKVYWGSSSEYYKKRIFNYCQKYKMELDCNVYRYGHNVGICFNVNSYEMTGAKTGLKPQQALSKLLHVLVSERYRPLSLYDLFNRIYSHEVYISGYSDDKIYQLIQRFKNFLRLAGLKIRLINNRGFYFLKINQSFSLTTKNIKRNDISMALYKKFKYNYFTVAQLMSTFDCSKRTAMYRIAQMRKQNLFVSKGATRNLKYRLL